MSGSTAAVLGFSIGVVLLLGYSVWLLLRYRAARRGSAGKTRGGAGGASTKADRPAPRLTRGQKALALAAFSIVASVSILGMIEGTLRLAGYGGYTPTFQLAGPLGQGRDLFVTDHSGPSTYFFADRSRPGSLDRDALVMPKPARTFRVMLVGGSAAKGFPYPRHLAASSFLEVMLADAMPGVNVEVVNLGTTAIASYPVLDIMTESLRFGPDLVVVYCGNNEFYGAYGVASLHSAGRSPASIRFTRAARSLAITQFIESRRPAYDTEIDRTLMETMVGRASIAPDDPMRDDAARNLRAFVGDMIDRCRAAGVPVIVCTPPGNERGLAPIGTEDLDGLTPEQRARLEELLVRARDLSDPIEAEVAAGSAIVNMPTHAEAHYRLALALEAQGREREAAPPFRRALDLDTMPWRAPSASVEAIREAARSRGGVLCDLVEIFRGASPGGVIGWELMDDHVHPSLAGQALIGRSIAAAVPLAIPSIGFTGRQIESLPGDDEYAARLGATEFDLYAAAHGMRVLGTIPFFLKTNPGFGARFNEVCREIEAAASPTVRAALHSWVARPERGGELVPITGVVAMALFERGEYAAAEPLFLTASIASPPYTSWELQYVSFALTCRGAVHGSLDEADRMLAAEMIGRGRFLIENGFSRSGAAERYVGELHLLRGENEEAIRHLRLARERVSEESRVAVDGSLVSALVRVGRLDEARAIVRNGLDAGGKFAEYYREMRGTIP